MTLHCSKKLAAKLAPVSPVVAALAIALSFLYASFRLSAA
jgi:hypothetical protein